MGYSLLSQSLSMPCKSIISKARMHQRRVPTTLAPATSQHGSSPQLNPQPISALSRQHLQLVSWSFLSQQTRSEKALSWRTGAECAQLLLATLPISPKQFPSIPTKSSSRLLAAQQTFGHAQCVQIIRITKSPKFGLENMLPIAELAVYTES